MQKSSKKAPIIDFKSTKIGFLGPEGTHCFEVAKKTFFKKVNPVRELRSPTACAGGGFEPPSAFGNNHQLKSVAFSNGVKLFSFLRIEEIFENVLSQEIDIGVVPAENTLGGIVPETIRLLIDCPLFVSGSYTSAIHHCLLARTKDIKDLKIILSHQQAFLQCKNWLQKNLPQIEFSPTSSTVTPILKEEDKKVGFIASEMTAKIYKLFILAKNIEDNKENFTKFYFLTSFLNQNLVKKLEAKKTLILLAAYNRVGVLRDILDVFAKVNLNLTALHSIPSHLRLWDYFFFVEIETPLSSPKIKKALKNIQKYCPIIRILGAA